MNKLFKKLACHIVGHKTREIITYYNDVMVVTKYCVRCKKEVSREVTSLPSEK